MLHKQVLFDYISTSTNKSDLFEFRYTKMNLDRWVGFSRSLTKSTYLGEQRWLWGIVWAFTLISVNVLCKRVDFRVLPAVFSLPPKRCLFWGKLFEMQIFRFPRGGSILEQNKIWVLSSASEVPHFQNPFASQRGRD